MRPSVCPIDRQQASAHSNNGAAARRSAANTASVVLTGDMLHIAFIVTHAYLLL